VVDERHLPLTVHRQIALKVTREVKINIGGSVYDPTDPIGKLLFTVLSMIAEFEAGLARMRTREGMAIAKAKGRLRGKKPKLSPSQEAHLTELHRAGRTPPPNSPNSSTSPAPPSTAPSTAQRRSKRPPVRRRRIVVFRWKLRAGP
jgi:hypothetical protein